MTPVQLALTGLELKEQGIASVSRHLWVGRARAWAKRYLRSFPTITSDALYYVMEAPPHPNCVGAVFRDKRFRWTGRYVKSKRPEAHARMIRIWRLA